jgi:hypothetical protein
MCAVLEAGREVGVRDKNKLCHPEGSQDSGDSQNEDLDAEDDNDEPCAPKKKKERVLIPYAQQIGEVPVDAIVTAEQAESALGHTQATELDADACELLDLELRQEEEALMGRQVNPVGVDYTCLCWTPDSVSADTFGWDLAKFPVRQLHRSDFEFSAEDMRMRVELGVEALIAEFKQELHREAAVDTGSLDPTQLEAFKVVSEWARKRQLWSDAKSLTAPPSLRMLLLGTAGTGKTHTAKLAITQARLIFGSFHSVLTIAFSGVAASNLGGGARTIDSVFHTNTDEAIEDLKGTALDSLVQVLRGVQLLVIDEISTTGAAQFEIISRRLEQVGKVLWRELHGQNLPSETLDGFGGLGVLLIGDFAQLPPVLSSSLLPQAAIEERKTSGKRSLALDGRKSFGRFEKVIRLRRIHRLLGKDPFKDSTLRLRDAAVSINDYALWKTHELPSLDEHDSAPWEGAEDLLSTALVLVTDNAQAGRVNGKRLAEGVPLLSEQRPGLAGNGHVVVRCAARHNSLRGCNLDAREFRNLRTATHLRVGARVILITNRIWDTDTVPLGLMNGARGVVVGIMFAPEQTQRVDGNAIAGTGFPTSDGLSFPRSMDQCPLPDFVVVHFPGYKGKPLLKDLPQTWVPVPCIEIRASGRKSLTRVGIPLKLAWGLTIHKSQGITEPQGIIISFDGSRMVRPVARMGLAFVAWTRATLWTRVAFRALPPLADFLSVRFSKEFQSRSSFETRADELHDALFAERGIVEDLHIREHQQHLQNKLKADHGREATDEELRDIEQMLRTRGVAPVSDCVLRAGAQKNGGISSGGLWSIVSSFRADKSAAKAKAKQKGRPKLEGLHKGTVASGGAAVILAILLEHGYPDEHIQEAIARHGPQLQNCVSHCLDRAGKAPPASGSTDELATEEDWAFSVITSLGYDEHTTTRALEDCNFLFTEALTLLLFGGDKARVAYAGTKQFRRHTTSRVYSASEAKLASSAVCEAYEARVQQEFGFKVRAVDLGQYAGRTTAACFWLSLAAALSRVAWEAPAHTLPGSSQADISWAAVRVLLQGVQAMSLDELDVKSTGSSLRDSSVGTLACLLRSHMCEGPSAVMLRETVVDMIFPAFAALDSQNERRQLRHYKAWVAKLATKEYADELVLLAVANELHIEITCVPFTPAGAPVPWMVSTYQRRSATRAELPRVILGNNDVHYMWLAAEPVSDSASAG